MTLDELVAAVPHVWHATYPGGWDVIRRAGLRSAADLLAANGRADESTRVRDQPIELDTADGRVVLRNQVPGRKDPAASLDGITVAEWWHLVNSRSYFFAREVHANGLIDAYMAKGAAQEILKCATRPLLTPVVDHVEVTTANAGVFPHQKGPTRGRGTFVPLAEFSGEARKIREITVTCTVPVPDAAVVKVVRMSPDDDPRRIWPPPS